MSHNPDPVCGNPNCRCAVPGRVCGEFLHYFSPYCIRCDPYPHPTTGNYTSGHEMWHEAGSRDLKSWTDIALPVTLLQLGWGEE